MGLEAATYIDELVISNPTGLDGVNEGDNHLRLIKSVLQNSFPAISGAVAASDVELSLLSGLTADAAELNILDGAVVTTAEVNYLSGVTGPLQAQIDGVLAAIDALFPIGHILHTATSANPSVAGYPGTWTRIAQGRCLIGEGTGAGLTTRVAGTSLGSEDAVVPAHSHNITQNSHSHGLSGGGSDDDGGPRPPGGNNAGSMNNAIAGANANITIDSEGVSPLGANMQPSLVVYIWQRTA